MFALPFTCCFKSLNSSSLRRWRMNPRGQGSETFTLRPHGPRRQTDDRGDRRRGQDDPSAPGVDPKGGGFERNADNPLDCDLLVIDEASMVNVMLMQG